jgi:tetratricopeptide (TPR) repeat protein
MPGAMVVRDDREASPRRNVGPIDNDLSQLERVIAETAPTSPAYPTALIALAEAWTLRRKASTGASSTEAGLRAIAAYSKAVKEYPNEPTMDRTLYHLGLEQEAASKLDQARVSYFKLVREQVSSRFVPHAYLAFGEFFRAEARSDPTNYQFALQSYKQVLVTAPPGEGVRTLAALRAREIYQIDHQDADAEQMLQIATESLEKYPSQHGASELRAMMR